MRDPDFPCAVWDEVAPDQYIRRAAHLLLSASGKAGDAAETSRLRELARRRREAGIVDEPLALSDDAGGDEGEKSRKRELNRRRQAAGLAAV